MSDGRALKLGFIPLDDAAAMIAAHEKGFFAAEGLQVELSREMSWATIRDKIAFGALDGAHMLAPLALAMTFRGGTHDLWVRYWLAAGGINPETDVSTIVIPPPQMVANMKAGTQDAFRVGEPWNGQLVNQRIGYLLDGPFGALDALTRAHLQDSVMEIHGKLKNTVLMITHDVDEAVLLSDRVVMMTNSPAAGIGEVLDVRLSRPRRRVEVHSHPAYVAARHAVIEFLYARNPAVRSAA